MLRFYLPWVKGLLKIKALCMVFFVLKIELPFTLIQQSRKTFN